MRRIVLALALGLTAVTFCVAQENPQQPAAARETSEPGMVWRWANFVILAVGLGYLIGKAAPAYFRARQNEIENALAEASKEIKDADAKAANLSVRLSGIQNEVENLRKSARAEMAAEGERIRIETERHLKRIQDQTSQEVVLMARAARDELRRYSAGLAIDLAEQRLRSRIGPAAQESLLDSFVVDLQRLRPAGGAGQENN
jgi:F-type H+-transporting ATPase subunit b